MILTYFNTFKVKLRIFIKYSCSYRSFKFMARAK